MREKCFFLEREVEIYTNILYYIKFNKLTVSFMLFNDFTGFRLKKKQNKNSA